MDKKLIVLSERAPASGEVRKPEEGAIWINIKEADRLIVEGKASPAPISLPAIVEPVAPEADG